MKLKIKRQRTNIITEISELGKTFWINLKSRIRRDNKFLKKQHKYAWERMVCRQTGLDRTGYENGLH